MVNFVEPPPKEKNDENNNETILEFPVKDDAVELLKTRGGSKLRVAIFGSGESVTQMHAIVNSERTEAKDFDDIDALLEYDPNLTFIVDRIPVKKNDTLDDAKLLDAILKIFNKTKSGVCLKSTINPETADRITDILKTIGNSRFIYNPPVDEPVGIHSNLLETKQIFGGDEVARRTHAAILDVHFFSPTVQMLGMGFRDAVIYKMALVGFTAIKQTFFAQLAQVADDFDVPMNRVRRFIQRDDIVTNPSYCIPPIVRSQTDENVSLKIARGYGGEYLNDDVRAFCGVTDKMTLLETAVNWSNVK
jgi:UDP-glucose 6-dehydrogenase